MAPVVMEHEEEVELFSRRLVRATWKLVLGSFLLHVHSEVDALLFMPFLYSRVHCCPETPEPAARYAVGYPETLNYGLNVSHLEACELPAMGVEDPAWSHSAHCGSFAYVRNRAQAVLSIYSPVRTTFTLIMFPTAGVVADVIGRKPVLVAAACGPLIAASIFWLDTYFELRTNMLLYCCSAVLALGRLVNPVIAAMLADSVTERERAVCFPVLQSMVQAGPLVGYFIGYYVLHLHLQDYQPYWEVMAVTQVIIVVFIRMLLTETLSDANASIAAKANEAAAAGSGASTFAPKRGYKLVDSSVKGEDSVDVIDDGSSDSFTQMEVGKADDNNGTNGQHSRKFSRHNRALSCTAIISHYTTGLALFRADRVLLGLAGIQLLSEFALHGFLGVTFSFLVGELHFTQEAAILPGITKKVSQTIASAFAAWMLPRTGQWAGAACGLVITSLGLWTYGIGSLCCLDQVGAYLGSVLLSFGIGLTTPALLTATSWRVVRYMLLAQQGPEHQAKVQASLTLVGSVGTAAGVSFHSRVLHEATAHGYEKALPMTVSAVAFLCSALLTVAVGCSAGWQDDPDFSKRRSGTSTTRDVATPRP